VTPEVGSDASEVSEPDPDLLSTAQAGPAAVRGGALRVGGFFIGAAGSAGSAALLFRHLGVVDVGRYVAILSLIAIVGGISDLGLTAVGLREASVRDEADRALLMRDLLGLRITLTVVGILVMLGFSSLAYTSTVVAGVAIAGIALLAQAVQDNYAVILQVNLRLGWVAVLEIARQVLTAAFMAALVIAGARLLAFISATVVAGVAVAVMGGLLVRSQRSLLPSFHWARWRLLLIQVLPYSAAVAASILYFRMAIVLVSLLASAHQLGLFSSSFRIIEVLYVVPGMLASAALPIFARAARDDHLRLGYAAGKVSEVALIVGAWVAVSLGIGAHLVMSVIGGTKFDAAAGVLAIEGIALGASFVGAVWANCMLSLRMNREILLVNVSFMVLSAALISVLVQLDGARGAAIGTAVGEILGALACALVVVRGRPQLRPSLRGLPKVAFAAAVALTPLLVVGMPIVLRLALSTSLYGLILLLTRALPAELKDLIPAGWARRGTVGG
jgi:O-antigen/teichoic acid export membrane protein